MKKEMINGGITLIGMGIMTCLSLILLSLCAYYLKWQSAEAMQGITFIYIWTGLMGGLLYGGLRRKKVSPKMGVLQAILCGIVLDSLYWGVLGGISMLLMKEHISDMGRFAICWSMMAGSAIAGILLALGGKKKT